MSSEQGNGAGGDSPRVYVERVHDYLASQGWKLDQTRVSDTVYLLGGTLPTDSDSPDRGIVIVAAGENDQLKQTHLKYLLQAAEKYDATVTVAHARAGTPDKSASLCQEYDVRFLKPEEIQSDPLGPTDGRNPSATDDQATRTERQTAIPEQPSADTKTASSAASPDISPESSATTDDASGISRRALIAAGLIGGVSVGAWYLTGRSSDFQQGDSQGSPLLDSSSPTGTTTPDDASTGTNNNGTTDQSLARYPMEGYNPAQTAFLSSAEAPVSDATVAWKATVGGEAHASPVVTEDTVYIATTAKQDAGLSALDSASGDQRWTALTDRRVRTAPAIHGDTIYVLTADTGRNLFAFNTANGEWRWASETDGDPSIASPVVTADALYISDQTAVQKFTTESGDKQWTFEPKRAQTHSFLAVVDGIVYIASRDASVYAVDAENGLEQWRFRPGNSTSSMLAAPAASAGRLYVSTAETGVFALDITTGKQIWQFGEGKRVNVSPAASPDTVYVGFDGTMYAIKAASGARQWRTEVGFVTGTPIVANGTVYVGADDTLIALDTETGAKRWSFSPENPGGEGRSFDGPAIANGRIYAENSGTVYALQ